MSEDHILCVVGVGLLGGSLALAARRRRVAARVIGTDRNPLSLGQALEAGILDEAQADLELAVAEADIVVFCAPVDCIAGLVESAAPYCKPGALLTDVGSTKARIVHQLQGRLPAGVSFVGSHPLAGSEKNGPQHARPDLFDGRLVVVTPGADTDDLTLARVRALWEGLGARVETMCPEEHDRALALTSHLPHLVAAALAGALPAEWQGLTATGFRDTTRLAGGSPALWTAIFRSNADAVLDALDRFDGQLQRFRTALAEDDRALLVELLRQGQQARASLPPS